MRIVFVGPPGAGKGTQSANLASHLKIPNLSTGEMLRKVVADGTDLGKRVAECMKNGHLVSDELVQQILFERLTEQDCEPGCIIDGFPRTVPQAEALDELFFQSDDKLDAVLEIYVPVEELLRRLAGRAREDDSREVVAERLRQFAEMTSPLLEYYDGRHVLHRIEGVGAPEEVFQRILTAVGAS